MSYFSHQLDELKIKFLEHSTDAAALLEVRTRLDEFEEVTGDSIEMSLNAALKRSILIK